MQPRNPADVVVVPTAGRSPDLDEIAAGTAGLEEGWSQAAVAQLTAAAAAADRWLAEHPDDAGRFVDDPAGVIAAMSEAGVLAEPVDDLLEILRSRASAGRRRAARPERGGAVRFAARPPLKAKARKGYPGQHGAR